MRIDKICKTCGFDSNGVCGMYTTCKEGEECDDWEASLEYYTEITKKAPWYIKKPYDQCNTTLQLFHKKNIVQDFLMYNEFDPKHYKGK